MKGKKGGGGGDAMTIIFSILLYALILVFFSVLMLSKGCSTSASEYMIYSEKSTLLEMDSFMMGYLRANVTINSRQYDMPELIGRYMAEPEKYGAQLQKATDAMLAQTSLPCPSLSVYFVDNSGVKDEKRSIESYSDCAASYRGGTASTTFGEGTIYHSTQKIPLQKNLNGAAIIEATSKGWD